MQAPIYKLTMTRYERRAPRCRWIETETETLYVSREWAETLTSDDELAFWRAAGSCEVSRNPYAGTVDVLRVSPDKILRTSERFEPVSVNPWAKAGEREHAILEGLPSMRVLPVIENLAGRTIVKIERDGRSCLLDLESGEYVG